MKEYLRYTLCGCLAALALLIGACSKPSLVGVKEQATPRADSRLSAAQLLDRSQGHIRAAETLRLERSPSPGMGAVFGWPPDRDQYMEYYHLARQDLELILERFPESAEAPEAQFTLGLICDHPHLNCFEEAHRAYQKTIENYPDSPAARKAEKRRDIIETIGAGYLNLTTRGEQ